MYRLVIRDAEGGEASFPVTSPVVIGRSRGCEIRLKDDSVSRRHARVHLDYGDPVVEDLSTPNGTMVNNERIRGAVRLRTGDVIQIANEKIRVIETSALEDFAVTTRIALDDEDLKRAKAGPSSPWKEPITPRAKMKDESYAEDSKEKEFLEEGHGSAPKKPGRIWPWLIAAGAVILLFVILMVVKK